MPVPTSIDDLSPIAIENSPQGTEPAKGTIDDYFRQHASYIAKLRDLIAVPAAAESITYAQGGAVSDVKAALDLLYYGVANVRNPKFAGGAKGDGVTDDSAAIQAAIDSFGATGGTVYIPRGVYLVAPAAANFACLWVSKENIAIEGDGAGSILKVAGNSHVPLHVSSERNLDVAPAGAEIINFRCEKISINGTGVYQNYGLAYGRGILLRKVKNAVIRGNFIFNMSMIGICVEDGSGNFLVEGNIVGDCKYTAINYNGRCYQSLIANNICYGSNAGPDSVAIQASGHCHIVNNTVFGSIGNYANCGGIMWGEGPYNGVGAVQGNFVKHCRFGIKAVYHGACNISGNTVVNCMTLGGILAIGGTVGGFSVESRDNKISGNTLINNYPAQIESSAPETMISDNKMWRMAAPVNPSAQTEPDAITDVVPEYSIRVTASGNSIINNSMRGSARGIVIMKGVALRNMHGNDIPSLAAPGLVVYESNKAAAVLVAYADLFERRSAGNGTYQNRVFGNAKPSQGFWQAGDLWERWPASVGQTLGSCVIGATDTTTTVAATAGATTLTLAAPVSAASGNTLGVELDNGAYHWATATGMAGSVVTVADAIPAGRSVLSGAAINGHQWRDLAILA